MKKYLVKIKTFPAARKEKVVNVSTNSGERTYEMYVREPAVRNLANIRVRELVARECGVQLPSVRMVSGARSRSKVFEVTA